MVYSIPFNDNCPRIYRMAENQIGNELYVVEIGYNRVPKGLKQIMKRNVYMLHYITDGKGRIFGGEFDANHAYIVTPGELEILEADADFPYETYWIMFHGTEVEKIIERCYLPNHSGVFEFGKNKACAEILHDLLFETQSVNEFEESYAMQAALYKILSIHMSSALSNSGDTLTVAAQLKAFIDRNYSKPIRIDGIAAQMNYSPSHIYRAFKQTYGLSPKSYLLTVRLEKAKQLLSEKISVSEAAYAVGFGDPLYFSRIFSRTTGQSPTEFKKYNS